MSLKKILEPFFGLSLRLKISILFILVFGLSMFVFSFGVFNFLSTTLQKEFDRALYNYAVDVLDSITLSPWGGLRFEGSELDREKIYPFSLGTALIQITNRNGQPVAKVGELGNFVLPFDEKAFQILSRQDASYMTILDVSDLASREAETYRMISFPVDDSRRPMLILQIAAPMTLLENQLATRKVAFQFGIPFVLLVATLGGLLLSQRTLRPVRRMIAQAAAISGQDLSRRLPVPKVVDEIQDLAFTLNSMLDRLQGSFLSQDRFVADASHQLLTPLSVMRGQLEDVLRQEPKLEQLIRGQLSEVDRLSRLVKDMLVLARVGAGKDALHLTQVEMDDVVIEAIQQVEKAKPNLNRRLNLMLPEDLKVDWKVEGDKDLLIQLAFNLIENAVKYSPDKGLVRVTLEQASSFASLVVENQAAPMSEEQLSRIFDRFHREGSVQGKVQGFGLGLTIAKTICEAHKGQLTAANAFDLNGESIIRFRLTLPLKNFNNSLSSSLT